MSARFAALAAAATAVTLRAGASGRSARSSGKAWSMRLWSRAGDEPRLLLHGLGATAATWLPLLGSTLADADVLLPELSAMGGTRGPRPALGVREAVDRLSELLERRSPGRPVTIAGVSLGGWIAVRLALARPDLVARLLLVVPGGYRDQDWNRIGRMVRVGRFAESREIWQALFERPPWFLRWGRPFLFLAYRSEAVAAALATLREEDAFGAEELSTLTLPVGLVWGEAISSSGRGRPPDGRRDPGIALLSRAEGRTRRAVGATRRVPRRRRALPARAPLALMPPMAEDRRRPGQRSPDRRRNRWPLPTF
ncbi:MAG: alpha/beta fold hydrolase [Thermoanaerobaculia bacterium]